MRFNPVLFLFFFVLPLTVEALVYELDFETHDIPISDYRLSAGDLLKMQGTGENNTTSLYTNVAFAEGSSIENVDGNNLIIQSPEKPSIVCYRDSFTTAMVEYYIYYFNGSLFWTFIIDFACLEETSLQYLVLCCVERYLDDVIAANSAVLSY